MDNSSEIPLLEKKVELYHTIHEYAEAGYSNTRIAKQLHCSRNTVQKYLAGDFNALCQRNFTSGIDVFYDYIIRELRAGVCRKDVFRAIVKKGYTGRQTAAYDYMNKIIERFQIDVAIYRSASPEIIQKKKELQKYYHVSRNQIFRFLWMGDKMETGIWEYLSEHFSQLNILKKSIQDFREIFRRKSMPCLYLFIENYKDCNIKLLSRFALGLERDLSAVENAVASALSNGLVEGTNSKLKMIKRTMYGRCSKELLAAKLIYNFEKL